MKTKLVTLGMVALAANVVVSGSAIADTTVSHSEATRVESESASGGMGDPAQLGARHTEFSREESHVNTPTRSTSTVEERRTSNAGMPPAVGSTSETVTRTTERTFRGTVRRIDENRAVVIVDGTQYEIKGPQVSEIIKQPDQRVIITGSLDQPTRTIDITRYEWIQ